MDYNTFTDVVELTSGPVAKNLAKRVEYLSESIDRSSSVPLEYMW